MQKLKWFDTFEGTLIALVPALVVTIAYLYQCGSYLYLGVPFELVELSTPKMIGSVFAIFFFLWFYTVIWIDGYADNPPRSRLGVVIWHVLVNGVMTCFVWFRPASGFVSSVISLALCLVFFTVGTLWLHKLLHLRKSGQKASLVASSTFVGYSLLVVVGLSTFQGAISEAKRSSRLVVRGTNLVFVGTYNGQYVLKEFDPETLILRADGATLMPPDKAIVLEQRKLSLKGAHESPPPKRAETASMK